MQDQLIQETIESMKDYVPKLLVASEKIAFDIQSNEGVWVETFISYLEGVHWVATAITGIQQIDPELLFDMDVNSLGEILQKLSEALEQQDFVTLCDLLQFEMQPLLKSYDDNLRGIVN